MVDIFIAATRQRDHNGDVLVLPFQGISKCMGRLKGGNDPFPLGKQLERFQCLGVCNANVLCSAAGVKVSMLWTDSRVVESGGNGV